MKNEEQSGETKFGEGARIDPDEADQAEARAREKAESGDNGTEDKSYKLRGASIFNYANRAIKGEESLLNNRWLCRGCGAFIVAPSGQGKSTLATQASACFAAGLDAFGLKPKIPLSSVIIQAEDIEGDLIQMSQVVDHLRLTPAQRELVDKHTWIETVNKIRGKGFIKILDEILSERPADIVWINPYGVYLDASIRDDDANSKFLYVQLNPLLEKHNCGALIPAHTPKTQYRDSTKFKSSDWMYSMAGAAVMTQWARGVIVIESTDVPGVFRFIAAKRENRLGWENNELYFAHSGEEGKLLWVPASPEQQRAAETKPGRKSKTINYDKTLELVPLLAPELKEKLEELIMNKLSLGRDLAKKALKVLEHDEKIFSWPMPIPGKKGRPPEGYARTPYGNNQAD